jgi:hypothetical protein
MLKQRWRKIAALTVVLAAALFLASFFSPAVYQICSPNEYTHQKECAHYHLGSYVISWIVTVLDAHNGLVTAIATVFVAGFTWTLYRTSSEQGDLTRQSIDLARQEFISTHRPKIIVRNVSSQGYVSGMPIPVTFTYTNIGDTPAKIDAVEAAVILILSNRIIPRGIAPTACNYDKGELISGDSGTVTQASRDNMDYEHSFGLHSGTRMLCVVGCIHYSDGNGVRRTTGFARCSDISDGRIFAAFTPINDPEYEYDY